HLKAQRNKRVHDLALPHIVQHHQTWGAACGCNCSQVLLHLLQAVKDVRHPVRSIRRRRAHLPGQALEERKEAALRSPPHSHPENTAAEVFPHARLANDSRGQHALPPSTHTDDCVGCTGLLRGGEAVGNFLYRSSLHVAAGQVKRSCGDRGHVR
ncbi:unnamed protein product, partial [Ectocarpus fasciculatus]